MLLFRWKILKWLLAAIVVAVSIYFLIRGVQNGVLAAN